MRTRVSRTLAVSLVFCALACGKPQAPPISAPASFNPEPAATAFNPEPPAPPTLANTGQVTVHVKGMTKALNLV